MIKITKGELRGKIITEVVVLRPKTYAYLIDGYGNDDYEKNKIINKKAKGTKKCAIKQNLCLKIIKIVCLIIKFYINHRRDLKAITIICT